MPLSTGQVLNNRYRIVKLLGQGGFGAVYHAWDTSLNAPCALKENYDVSPEAARQFAKEASLLANLRHTNLPKVMDHFSLPGQGQYLVMEYIEGQDLQEMLDQAGGPLPEAQALAWIGQVCDALSYLHSRTQPVIHRDLKPANIRITPEGQAVLVDFGIAKVYDPVKRTSTAARAVTPGYAPFEQYGQRPTDARTDLYALGATLYHLLTGQKPPDSVDRIPSDSLLAPRRLNPAISAQVEAAVLKALRIDPDQRWQSAAEFKKAISVQPSAVSRPQSTGSSVQYTVGSAPAAAPPISQSQVPNFQSPASNLNWLFALAGVILVAIILWALVGHDRAGATDDFSATQTALAEIIEQATADARPTRTRAPSDTPDKPAATWTAGLTDTPLPTETPLSTDTPAGIAGMVLVPAGEFQMGSADGESDERPVHAVYLDAFYIDVYEVTNAHYAECVNAGGCSAPGNTSHYSTSSYADHPVVYVDWNQARAYCQWRGDDLPTEAQWEKAAHGGLEGKKYPWGDENPDCPRVNYWGKDGGCVGDSNTQAVDGYSPNGYGLYDMAGNVWEWVQDWYQSDYYASQITWRNPFGPSSGDGRVLRGGSWNVEASDLRAAYRGRSTPSIRNYYIGLRCSRSP